MCQPAYAQGFGGAGWLGCLLFSLLLQLVLALKDRTPLLVVGHWHTTFDAHLDALLGGFALTK